MIRDNTKPGGCVSLRSDGAGDATLPRICVVPCEVYARSVKYILRSIVVACRLNLLFAPPSFIYAQVFGEERLKRGAYLAGLADGPSLAQDLGLSPKDRLICVEGLDVKTLPFERIGTRLSSTEYCL